MSKVAVLLPTCEPESFLNIFLPTIYKLKSLKDLIEFNICFQPPYTKDEINKILEEFKKNNLKVNYFEKDYKITKPYTPLNKMRNDCSLLTPEMDYYLLMDDDFSIEDESACDYIKKAIQLLDEDASLCAVSLFNLPVQNWRENFYSTNSGLFYRGGKYYGFKGLLPEKLTDFNKTVNTLVPYQGENLINLFGGFQDKFCAMLRLATGDKGISLNNVPINHVENRKQKGSIAHGWDDAKFKIGSNAYFIQKYFNPRYLETHSLTLFDKALDMKIYPSHYNEGHIKDEFNDYDDKGFSWEFNYYNYVEALKLNPDCGLTLEQVTAGIPAKWKRS